MTQQESEERTERGETLAAAMHELIRATEHEDSDVLVATSFGDEIAIRQHASDEMVAQVCAKIICGSGWMARRVAALVAESELSDDDRVEPVEQEEGK